MMKLML